MLSGGKKAKLSVVSVGEHGIIIMACLIYLNNALNR